MPPTPQLPMELTRVSLLQGQSLEPYLKLTLKIKLQSNGNNVGISEISLFNIRGQVFVSTEISRDREYEIGYAESIPTSNRLYGTGSEMGVEMVLKLSPYLLHKMEALRDGKDLFFQLEGWVYVFANVIRTEGVSTELINLISTGGNPTRKYPRSEWIDDLNKTDLDMVELIEIPRIEFSQVPLQM
ncbi:MAG: hypothetical protein ACREAY_01010 [Nitrososphaera sp.]|uniref:hypothetical protein n=1 Tax=Nitrososphaera sp. TaxID=1971748 RepID=UPI003D6FD4C9